MCIAQTFKDSTLTCVHLTSCEEGAITPILQIRKQEGLKVCPKSPHWEVAEMLSEAKAESKKKTYIFSYPMPTQFPQNRTEMSQLDPRISNLGA